MAVGIEQRSGRLLPDIQQAVPVAILDVGAVDRGRERDAVERAQVLLRDRRRDLVRHATRRRRGREDPIVTVEGGVVPFLAEAGAEGVGGERCVVGERRLVEPDDLVLVRLAVSADQGELGRARLSVVEARHGQLHAIGRLVHREGAVVEDQGAQRSARHAEQRDQTCADGLDVVADRQLHGMRAVDLELAEVRPWSVVDLKVTGHVHPVGKGPLRAARVARAAAAAPARGGAGPKTLGEDPFRRVEGVAAEHRAHPTGVRRVLASNHLPVEERAGEVRAFGDAREIDCSRPGAVEADTGNRVVAGQEEGLEVIQRLGRLRADAGVPEVEQDRGGNGDKECTLHVKAPKPGNVKDASESTTTQLGGGVGHRASKNARHGHDDGTN